MNTALVAVAIVTLAAILLASSAAVWLLWRADRRARPVVYKCASTINVTDVKAAAEAAKAVDHVLARQRLTSTIRAR
ncbi:hypothetical protein [Nocardia sp. NPDC051833]|uniref:hypothetical protein n=1 Tax=Nocardia sp. NPDC051833 TaxID=3155674 RepID=UPI003440CB02